MRKRSGAPPATVPVETVAGQDSPAAAAARSTAALEHELHVHQIELELQNEDLRRAQVDLARARDRFIDLYDFAPVGYLTLDAEGIVVEANLTGAALLGEERAALLKHRLARFVSAADRERWRRHLRLAMHGATSQRIELALQPRSGAAFDAQLDCLRIESPGAEPQLRITLTDISQHKQAETNRRIATTAIEAREAEGRTVARELHEELGQRLSALKMELASLKRDAPGASGQARLASMLETVDDAIAMVRRIATGLRPLLLDDLGLNAAIDWLARDTARRTGLGITLHLDDSDPPLAERTATAVFRMVQAALAEIAGQALADDVDIELRRRAGEVVLVVQHNGTGWPQPRPGDGADATTSLRDRAHLAGGRLELESTATGGRRFTVHLPLSGDPARPA